MKAEHPNKADDEVIAKRHIIENEDLPETTAEEQKEKIKALEKEKKDAEEVASYDMLGDETDQSVIKVYRDERKQQIQPIRESTLDAILRKKAAAIGTIVSRIEKSKEKINAAKETIDANDKNASSDQRNLRFNTSSRAAQEYLLHAIPYTRNRKRRKKLVGITSARK